MRNNQIKKTSCVLAMLLTASCFGSCAFLGQTQGSSSSQEVSSHEEVQSGLLYENRTNKIHQLATGQEVEILIGKEVQNNNFLTIQLLNDCNLIGHIYYTNSKNPDVTHKERIYIEAGAQTFSMFLDAFRVGAFGNFEKKIDKITLRNVDEGKGGVRVNRVEIGDRTYDNQEMLYVQNKHLKIGASLAAGGSLCHVESLDRKVLEYIDEVGRVRIDENMDKEGLNLITDKVNFVNIHDLGREIQQSFYANINETHGYAPDDDVLYEGRLVYNPVQAGSAGDNQSQIIDYRVEEDAIYVKCRPQDWFFRNTQTDSYMESTYSFAEDGTLRVTNRFVNFSEYKGMETAYIGGQETPAIYLVHPLNYFYCETRNGVVFDPNLKDAVTTPSKTSLDDDVEKDYHYTLDKTEIPSEWFAFVNDKKFGVGIYMPKVDQLVASRGWTSTFYQMSLNSRYNSNLYNLSGWKYPSAYVPNYNYCCPSVIRRMVDFVPFEYTFALYVGTVVEMKDTFGKLKRDNVITNDGIEAWETRAY